MTDSDNYCKWVVRPGINNSIWAYTPCNSGFNYLSRVSRVSEVEDAYNGRLCPICGKPIKINITLLKDEIIEV